MTKQKEPDSTGKQILNDNKQQVKQSQKEKRSNNMKNILNSDKFKTFKHVALTLITLAVIAGLLFAGFQYGRSYERDLNTHVQSQVKAAVLSASTEAPASK